MSPDVNIPAIIQVAREAGVASVIKPEQKTINGVDCLVTKDGTIIPLQVAERFLSAPRRKRAEVKLYEGRSFIDYVNRHKLAGRTHIFGIATELGGGFEAVIDYHAQEQAADAKPVEGKAVAGYGEHTATLTLETTPEWRRWIENNRKLMSQEAFAEFVQDNMNDIIRPDAADLVEMAQLLIGKKTVSFRGGKNLKNGAIALEYTEVIDVQGTGNRRDDTMQVPDEFTLGIVPFVGANGVEITARLRFRIGDDKKLYFMYVLNRPYKVIETAFSVAREDIEKGTGTSVLLGSGEITIV